MHVANKKSAKKKEREENIYANEISLYPIY